MLYPFQAGSRETRAQAFLRASGSGNASRDIVAKFSTITRCRSGCIFAHLRPDILSRVEFWRSSGKPVNDQAFMLCQEFLYDLALMNRVVIPDKYDVAGSTTQKLLEKGDDFFASQTMPVRAYAQPVSFSAGQDQQSTNDVETIMMANAGANDRRFATRCPSALERRDQ